MCHGSGSAASAATIVLAAAAKHILQIVDLLDERCMNYTFPINKQDVLLNAGVSILWQCMDLEDDSKIIKDNQKSLSLLMTKLSRENNVACGEFQKVASSFVTVGSPRAGQPRHIPIDTPAAKLLSSMPAPISPKQKTAKKQLQAIASRFSTFTKETKNDDPQKRRAASSQSGAAIANVSPCPRTNSTVSLASTQSAPAMQLSTPSPQAMTANRPIGPAASVVNLDYFHFDGTFQALQSHNSSSTMLPPKKQSSPSNGSWEHLATSDFENPTALYNTVEPNVLSKCISNPEALDWTGDVWNIGGFHAERAPAPQSLLSFSEESLTSGDDFVFSTAGSHNGSMSTHDGIDLVASEESFKGITMPVSSIEDELDFSPVVHP